MPSEYSSRGIVQMLVMLHAEYMGLAQRFGSSELTDGLQNNGATTNEIVLYT